MSASEELRQKLHARANGNCECMMRVCSHHTGRCNAMLREEWEVHRRIASREYSMSNCVAMCQRCHRNTPSYGHG